MRVWALVLLVSCGARSDLSQPDVGEAGAVVPANGCTDALDLNAFTPVDRYCSNRARRAPAMAPRHARVAWTTLAGPRDLVVGSDGRAIMTSGWAVSACHLDGTLAWWTPMELADGPLFLPASGGVRVLRGNDDPPLKPMELVTVGEADGHVTGSTPWPIGARGALVGSDGSMFIELASRSPAGSDFAGISRMAPDGTLLWTEKSTCKQPGDVPEPYAFALRGDHLLLVCTNQEQTIVHSLEVDAGDAVVAEAWLDGSLLSDVVVAPSGHAFFLIGHRGGPMQLADLGSDAASPVVHDLVVVAEQWDLLHVLAVAADGTLVFGAESELVAVRDAAIRWRVPLVRNELQDMLVDSDHTVVVATDASVIGLDLEGGARLWEYPVWTARIASAGPGKLYVWNAASLALLSD